MTAIWGLTEGGRKRTGSDPRVRPEVVVYDPELTLGLPPRVAGPSGMNAVAHCVEGLYGPRANPVASLMALEGLRALHRSLPVVCAAPGDLGARTEALYGAYLAGAVLGSAGTALHHKTCHVLGGTFGLDHADANAVVLGHALAYNAPAIPGVLADIEAALGTGDAPGALFDLAAAVGAPTSLAAIGMPEDGLDEATGLLVVEAAANVRPPEPEGIRRMLADAFAGRRPAAVPARR
jgi:maleylacetate reductase